MSEFSKLIPRIPQHIGFPATEAGILDLASEFQIAVQSNHMAVLDRLKSLEANGVRDGTSAYQAIALDDVAYANWLEHRHVTFDFYGAKGFSSFVHEHSSRAIVPLAVFEARLKTLVEAGYAISRSTLMNALTKVAFAPRARNSQPSQTKIASASAQDGDNGRAIVKAVASEELGPPESRKRHPFVYDGKRFPELVGREFKTKTEFIRATGTTLHITVVRMRLAKGWDMDDAVSLDADLRGSVNRKPRGPQRAKNLQSVGNRTDKIPVVYVATSKTTGLKFVGATRKNSPKKSWRNVLKNARNHADLYAALSKLSSSDFVVQTVEVVGEGDPGAARERWIRRLGTTFPNGYNIPKRKRRSLNESTPGIGQN